MLFGGHSVEHEVSVISGIQALMALDNTRYEGVPLYITKDNCFYTGGRTGEIEAYRDIPALLAGATRVLLVPAKGGTVEMIRYPMKKFGSNVVGSFEVALPVVHGTNVEDGTLMGMLEMLGVPYAGCDVTASALGMDKYQMKAALRQAGLPVLDAVQFTGKAYAASSAAVLDAVEAKLAYPVIVKPVNLGSSVGISRADGRDALRQALDEAFGYASRVLVERAVPNLREINCAVLGDLDGAQASACEIPVSSDDILSYRDKYLGGGKGVGTTPGNGAKSAGMSGLKRRCPADIPDELTAQVQRLAVETFRALGCAGVARIDFLNDTESGELWVNEINTIPGSLAFYLWVAAGLPFGKLLDKMIALAFKRQRDRDALTFSYDTNLLAGVTLGGAKGAKGAKR